MISFDFAYYKPTTIQEALEQFDHVKNMRKKAIYYSGGTEWISRARRNEVTADAIIDLKGIPDCSTFEQRDGKLIIGSSVPLNTLARSSHFPLLSRVAKTIATHTERNKITIGGNIMSHLPYREAMMPFLLVDSSVHIAGKNGMRELPITDLAANKSSLAADEFIVHIETDEKMMNTPHFHSRKTKQSALNYPIVALASIKYQDQIRFACSGLCAEPFRDLRMESMINDHSLPVDQRIERAIQSVQAPMIDDPQASKEYRTFLLHQTIKNMLEQIEGVTQ